MTFEGQWVHGLDWGVGLPVYSDESFPTPAEAICDAVRKFGLDAYRYTLVVGKLVRPGMPVVDPRRVLASLYSTRYEHAEAVLYAPTGTPVGGLWRDGSVPLNMLKESIETVMQEWVSSHSRELGWYEVADEIIVSKEEILAVLNASRETKS